MATSETFLVVLHQYASNFVRAFIWQGTYEDVYKLDHRSWDLTIFLIQPDATEQPGALGQPLQHVEDLRCINRIQDHLVSAGYYLRQLPEAQRRKELDNAIARLRIEADSLTQAESYPDTPQGNLQRLIDRGITPLSDEDMDDLRR